MSTVSPSPPTRLDVSQSSGIPFTNLLRVELRKSVDTASGRWLLISTAILALLVMTIQLLVVLAEDLSVQLEDFLLSTNFSVAILLPVIGILLVTSEWSQRTAMVTFSLEPRRSRVVVAKLVVGLIIALLASVISLALACGLNLLYGAASGDEVVWGLTGNMVLGFLVLQVIGMVFGFAVAALLLNSPAAIVVYFAYMFVLPPLFQMAASLMDWFEDIQPWVDLSAAQGSLIEGASAEEWVQVFVSALIWIGIPLAFGLRRILRAEVK